MPHDELDLVGVAEPEIVFGLVGALGTPVEEVVAWLSDELREVSYEAEAIRLSDFLAAYDDLDTLPPADGDPPDVRLNALMDRGNQLRVRLDRGDALAMHAAAHIQQQMGLSADKEQALLQRDAGEELKLGQQVTKTYHLADLFLEVILAAARAGIPVKGSTLYTPRRFSTLFSSAEADGTRVPRQEKGGRVRTKPVGL
jgi:hypothetical protein